MGREQCILRVVREGVREEWRVTWDCSDSEGHCRQRKQQRQRFERLRKDPSYLSDPSDPPYPLDP